MFPKDLPEGIPKGNIAEISIGIHSVMITGFPEGIPESIREGLPVGHRVGFPERNPSRANSIGDPSNKL